MFESPLRDVYTPVYLYLYPMRAFRWHDILGHSFIDASIFSGFLVFRGSDFTATAARRLELTCTWYSVGSSHETLLGKISFRAPCTTVPAVRSVRIILALVNVD